MADNFEKIYQKYFDEGGNMREAGKKIVDKGMKDLKTKNLPLSKGPKTITEMGVFTPGSKAQSAIKYATKAAKATTLGKILVGAGALGAVGKTIKDKYFSDSDKKTKDVEKKSTGGMMIGKGKDYIKDLL